MRVRGKKTLPFFTLLLRGFTDGITLFRGVNKLGKYIYVKYNDIY